LDILAESRDIQNNNTYTATRGVTDASTTLSIMVSGTITKKAAASIVGGDLVKVDATNPLTHGAKWLTSRAANLLLGRYVTNETQFHDANNLAPTTNTNDLIKIDIASSFP
jgi:hypothetical protein